MPRTRLAVTVGTRPNDILAMIHHFNSLFNDTLYKNKMVYWYTRNTMATRKPYKKPKHYTPLKIEDEVHNNLLRLQSLRFLRTGKKVSLNALIKEMVDSQPTYEVTAKEVTAKQQK
jgi:hypothetical protein